MTGAGLARFDAHGRLIWANPAFADSLGASGDLNSAPLAVLLDTALRDGALGDPEGRSAFDIVRRLSDGTMAVLRRRGGAWVALALAEDGEGGRLLSVARTEAPETAATAGRLRALQERQAVLETAFDTMVDAIAGFDRDLRLVLWNRNYFELSRLPPDAIRIGTRFEDIVRAMAARGDYGEVDTEAFTAERVAAARSNEPFHFQFTLWGGTVFDARHLPLPGGGFLRRYVDITDRARAEEAQRAVLEAMAVPLVVTRSADGTVLLANQSALEFFGRSREEALGDLRAADVYVDPEERQRIMDALRAGGGRLQAFETRMVATGGREAWVLLSIRSFRFHGEDAQLACVSDITERIRAGEAVRAAKEQAEQALHDLKQAQAHLIQSEKMAALGSLVAGVAHEINTPVGIALTGASLLAERTRDIQRDFDAGRLRKADLADYLETAAEASQLMMLNVDRAAQLIQSFKQMAVDQASGERRAFDLRDYIHEVLRSLGVRLKRAAHRVEVTCPDDVVLDGYPGAFSQLLTNLVMNSLTHAYAPGEHGCLRISARRLDGDRVELVYSDDGRGIPADLHVRVFEPFFTTCRGSGGSGLGLNIVYNLATRTLKGRIALDSTPGRGATFTLTFPRVIA